MFYFNEADSVLEDIFKEKNVDDYLENNNDPTTLLKVGKMYENGNGVILNLVEAKKYLIKAAELDDHDAQLACWKFFKDYNTYKIFESVDPKIYINYLKKAIKADNIEALYEGWVMYSSGFKYKNKHDPDEQTILKACSSKAIDCLERAAALGHPKAPFELALHYYNQAMTNINANPTVTKNYIDLQKAANLNHPQALYQLGLLYKKGFGSNTDGAPPNNKKSLEYLINATMYGYEDINELEQAFASKEYIPTSDGNEHLKFFKDEAKKGKNNALIIIGLMYQYAFGTPENKHKALKYYKRAKKLGLKQVEHTLDTLQKQIQNSVAKTKEEVISPATP